MFTGGTFSASCTYSNPKTIGVVLLEGSEGQRMPIEFMAQRMATMPESIFYDFACAALKTALARLHFFAIVLAFLVDHLHWCKNHNWCSKAMNPDSYASVDGRNTSASEERIATSLRLQNVLPLVKQRKDFLFTVYKKEVGHVIAMHRDVHTPRMADRWPLWYMKKFVDVTVKLPGEGQGESAGEGGLRPRASAGDVGTQSDAGDGEGGESENVKLGREKR